VLTIRRQEQTLAVLAERVAVFIPGHVPDPSLRRPGEELWVEVTVPKKGPPRPIRLGIKKGDGPIVPLEFEMEARAPPVPVSQHRKKIPVAVSHSGQDKAAGELTLALTEATGASQSFQLVDHEWNPSTPRILVMVHSARS
jgi:hypothetical protein